jgi:hypothetical protein
MNWLSQGTSIMISRFLQSYVRKTAGKNSSFVRVDVIWVKFESEIWKCVNYLTIVIFLLKSLELRNYFYYYSYYCIVWCLIFHFNRRFIEFLLVFIVSWVLPFVTCPCSLYCFCYEPFVFWLTVFINNNWSELFKVTHTTFARCVEIRVTIPVFLNLCETAAR